jgi:hypothetical protein
MCGLVEEERIVPVCSDDPLATTALCVSKNTTPVAGRGVCKEEKQDVQRVKQN